MGSSVEKTNTKHSKNTQVLHVLSLSCTCMHVHSTGVQRETETCRDRVGRTVTERREKAKENEKRKEKKFNLIIIFFVLKMCQWTDKGYMLTLN